MAKDPATKGDGVLVGTGGFGIDSRRAVDVLRRRQLKEGSELAPLLWVRLAVAAGATRVVLVHEPGRFEVRFDGRPLAPGLLARPYDAYLGSLAGDEGARLFGLALLHLAREGVATEVVSGAMPKRMGIFLDGPGGEPPRPAEEPGDDTVVLAVWSEPKGRVPEGHPASWDLDSLADRLGPCPIPVTLGRADLRKGFLPWDRRFKGESQVLKLWDARTAMRVLPIPTPDTKVSFAVMGVAVETLRLAPLPLAVEGWVDDPGFALTASLDKVVRDRRFSTMQAAAGKAAADAFAAALARHATRMDLVADLLRRAPGRLSAWRGELELRDFPDRDATPRGRVKATGGFFSAPSGDAALIVEAALWARALREGANDWLRNPRKDAGDPLREALWDAALFLDKKLDPVSLRQVSAWKTNAGPRAPLELEDSRFAARFLRNHGDG